MNNNSIKVFNKHFNKIYTKHSNIYINYKHTQLLDISSRLLGYSDYNNYTKDNKFLDYNYFIKKINQNFEKVITKELNTFKKRYFHSDIINLKNDLIFYFKYLEMNNLRKEINDNMYSNQLPLDLSFEYLLKDYQHSLSLCDDINNICILDIKNDIQYYIDFHEGNFLSDLLDKSFEFIENEILTISYNIIDFKLPNINSLNKDIYINTENSYSDKVLNIGIRFCKKDIDIFKTEFKEIINSLYINIIDILTIYYEVNKRNLL
jgi:hypothetical protein